MEHCPFAEMLCRLPGWCPGTMRGASVQLTGYRYPPYKSPSIGVPGAVPGRVKNRAFPGTSGNRAQENPLVNPRTYEGAAQRKTECEGSALTN